MCSALQKIKLMRTGKSGLTLIEIIIFTVLLSILMTTLIQYLYSLHIQNLTLMQTIQDEQNK